MSTFYGSSAMAGKCTYGDFQECNKEAGQGDVRAQTMLGIMYFEGKGVPQDYKAALKWYTKAADQGVAVAQYSLGTMYFKGEGVLQDYKTAEKWYTKSADQGDVGAQYSLGYMYGNGWGVRQDYVYAYMWFNLAAANGKKNSQKMKDILAKKMTPSQIERARQMSRDWKPVKK